MHLSPVSSFKTELFINECTKHPWKYGEKDQEWSPRSLIQNFDFFLFSTLRFDNKNSFNSLHVGLGWILTYPQQFKGKSLTSLECSKLEQLTWSKCFKLGPLTPIECSKLEPLTSLECFVLRAFSSFLLISLKIKGISEINFTGVIRTKISIF